MCVHEIMGYYVFVRSLYLYYVCTRVTNGRSMLCSVYGIGTRLDGRHIDLLSIQTNICYERRSKFDRLTTRWVKLK